MEPQTDLPALVEDLDVNIDELGATLAPLVDAPLAKTASSLPLLDKAKLYVLAAYAIESLLFSTLQASGVSAKDHAIFPELARLKGYFAKIKEVEERGAKPKTKLDVGAAQRFIKHGLSGNEKYDLQRREREAKDKARAALKARQVNKKFDDEDDITPRKRGADEAANHDDVLSEPNAISSTEPHASKKPRVSTTHSTDTDSTPSTSTKDHQQKKSRRKPSPQPSQADTTTPKKRKGRSKKSALHDSPPSPQLPTQQDTTTISTTKDTPPPTTSRKSRRHNPHTYDADRSEEAIVPPPQDTSTKPRSAMFQKLLDGDVGGDGAGSGKGKGKGGAAKGKGKGRGKAR